MKGLRPLFLPAVSLPILLIIFTLLTSFSFLFLSRDAGAGIILSPPRNSLALRLGPADPVPEVQVQGWYCFEGEQDDDLSQNLLMIIKMLSDGPASHVKGDKPVDWGKLLPKVMEVDSLVHLAGSFMRRKNVEPVEFFHLSPADPLSGQFSPTADPETVREITIFGCFTMDELDKMKETALEASRAYLNKKATPLSSDLPQPHTLSININREDTPVGKDFGDAPGEKYFDPDSQCGYPSLLADDGVHHLDEAVQRRLAFRFRRLNHQAVGHRPVHGRGMDAEVDQPLGDVRQRHAAGEKRLGHRHELMGAPTPLGGIEIRRVKTLANPRRHVVRVKHRRLRDVPQPLGPTRGKVRPTPKQHPHLPHKTPYPPNRLGPIKIQKVFTPLPALSPAFSCSPLGP